MLIRTNDVLVQQELFPPPLKDGEFQPLFDAHGQEVRGRPFELDYTRYHKIEFEGRLVWIVARDYVRGPIDTRNPIGYSCSSWYRDLNFNERVAADGLWFVLPAFRNRGIGKALKFAGHALLEKAGVVRTYDTIRGKFNHPTLMADIGLIPTGIRWERELR